MLRRTWCTPELQEAQQCGYRIVKSYEVWHFPEIQRKKGLFANYVDKWLKIKQESSGYPAWVNTEDTKADYRRRYYDKEHIHLDPKQIRNNQGRKATVI